MPKEHDDLSHFYSIYNKDILALIDFGQCPSLMALITDLPANSDNNLNITVTYDDLIDGPLLACAQRGHH